MVTKLKNTSVVQTLYSMKDKARNNCIIDIDLGFMIPVIYIHID